MGTEISLSVGGVDVDWSKNSPGADHGSLFQEGDRKRVKSDQVNYDYFQNDDDPELARMEMAFSRSLGGVLPRLELLGFSLERVKREYNTMLAEAEAEAEAEADTSDGFMSFDEFLEFIKSVPLEGLSSEFIMGFEDVDQKKIMGRFSDEDFKSKIPFYNLSGGIDAFSERSYFLSLIGLFNHPYNVLRLLAENQNNLGCEVLWQYGPLVENGWADESYFNGDAKRYETFLMVTEGTSDISILKKAISLLRPGIEDFFRFIDVSERHPFSGTGNLVKFAEGLAKIDVQNQIIFILDNDAEGVFAHNKISDLNLPSNMTAMLLPEIDELKAMKCEGPDGTSNADVNGKAAAIECYLDLKAPGLPEPKILWTNYKKELGLYQGALQHKDSFSKKFYKQTAESISDGSYDCSKLQLVLDEIFRSAQRLAG